MTTVLKVRISAVFADKLNYAGIAAENLNKLVFVGGMEVRVITRFRAGFKLVLNLLTPSIKV